MGGARDAGDVRDVLLREDLRLRLVQSQIPHTIEVVQLLDGLGHLRLRVRQNQHVVCEGQEVASSDHFFQFFSGTQCLFQIHIEQHGREHTTLYHT